jgi:hypothetical protein
MAPMSRWDEPTLEDEIAWLVRDLNAAEDVRDALPPASRDRALVEETIRSLGLRLTILLRSSGRLVDDSDLIIRGARRDAQRSRAPSQRAARRQASGSSGA